MTAASFRVVPLDGAHDRTAFDCGTEPLNAYFAQQVSQDMRRKVTSCFVALTQDQCIAAFYTLASASLLLSDVPENLSKKLPRYPTVPAVRMGRLAVDLRFKGQGLGGAMLGDALSRVLRSDIAAYALVVEAKDNTAAFYLHHGFIASTSLPMTLLLPLATARGLIK